MLKQPSTGGDDGSRFSPLVVVELAPDTKEEAVAWLMSKIRDGEQNGGILMNSDILQTQGLPSTDRRDILALLISCSFVPFVSSGFCHFHPAPRCPAAGGAAGAGCGWGRQPEGEPQCVPGGGVAPEAALRG